MKKFYCKGKKDFCEDYDRCLTNCRYFDGSGGGYRKVPMTNANRIRAMNDEELAWELMLWRCEAVARHHGISSEYPDTQKTILEWLQQPAGEEDKHESN